MPAHAVGYEQPCVRVLLGPTSNFLGYETLNQMEMTMTDFGNNKNQKKDT